MPIADSLIEQIVQAIAGAIWQRPELTALRDPIETALEGKAFKQLTREAFEKLPADVLPFFDEGYIGMPLVQQQLVAHIVDGANVDLDELERLYQKRLPAGQSVPDDFRPALEGYLRQVRETFAAHPAYGPLLLARDVQSIYAVVNLMRAEMLDNFREVLAQFDALRQEPEIKALIERKTSHHIFLSYTRDDIVPALRIRNALEDAGHPVWQDTTAIKTGADWIESIEDGIERSYALVSVVSDQSQQSRWVKIEYLHAQRREKPIFPIKVDGCEIPTLMLLDNVAIAHPDFDGGLNKLLGDLPPAAVASATTLPPPQPVDRRQLEIKYLDGVLLEHSVWQELYTPMAGVGQMRKIQPQNQKPQMRTTAQGIESKFKARMKAAGLTHEAMAEMEPKNYSDILPAVEELKRLVILGDPGAGKSTTLWRIAADAAERAKDNPASPLPILIRMGELGGTTLREKLDEHLGKLAPHYDDLLNEKRLLFLLDGLNELPTKGRADNLTALKALFKTCEQGGMTAAITCREHDYTGDFDLKIPEKVVITPLDPPRIHRFVNGYITAPEGAGDALFWELAGDYAHDRWQEFSKAVGEPLETFWLAQELPGDKRWEPSWDRGSNRLWERWLKDRRQPRSLLELATNPYMLYMITQVYTEEGALPPNRGGLFKLFVEFLLEDREKLSPEIAAELQDHLADLGYEMQREGEGTTFKRTAALTYLGDETSLTRALSASLLTGSDEIRFTHQLLQEYFAAKRLDREMQAGTPATQFFPPDKWWEPTGWEETAILLAGLYSDDCSPVVNWLRDAQPELAARCILESGAGIDDTTYAGLGEDWLPRLTDLSDDPEARARAAVGRGLGALDYDTLSNRHQRPILDNRKGIGVIVREEVTVPDIDWVQIPSGEFIYQDGEKLTLPTFSMSRYPITYAQFQTFLDDPEGMADDRWWTGLARTHKEPYEQAFKYANHPRENVNWYQAIAFCRWLSWRLGGIYELDRVMDWAVRLPIEQEWEKAARGMDGRVYPWGDDWDATKCNNDVENGIGQTSAVGIFPDGASPYEVLDMSGNVWEWCLTDYSGETGDLSNTNSRVLRGGSWRYVNTVDFRAAYRDWLDPDYWYNYGGFRVSRSY